MELNKHQEESNVWLEEKEKEIEVLKERFNRLITSSNNETSRYISSQIGAARREIEAYKQGQADAERKCFGDWKVGDECWFEGYLNEVTKGMITDRVIKQEVGEFYLEVTYYDKMLLQEQCSQELPMSLFKTELEAQEELDRTKEE